MKKLTTKQFIEKAMKKHGDKYDYSLSVYNGGKSKIKIICPIHGEFYQNAKNHMSGSGCKKCSGLDRITLKSFIERSNNIHNNKFDYSFVEFRNNKSKIKIICPIHGIFEQSVKKHLSGDGCAECSGNKRLNEETFIKRAKSIHYDRYDYSLVFYNGFDEKVKIICPEHGIFEQTPNKHIGKNNRGCPKCNGGINIDTQTFIDRSRKIHGNKYDYSLVEYINSSTKVKIICKKHGIFEQKPRHHIYGCGCTKCLESNGEKKISIYLDNKYIKYKRQQVFDDCKNIRKLQFDFYLPEYNTCIEYDGEQHYKSIEYFGGVKSFKLRQKRDMIKNDYCKNNNIKLLRIKYDENIENKLTEYGFGL